MTITLEQISDAMKTGDCEIKTRYGGWRFVVALFTDGYVGTIRATGNSAGTWRVQEISRFVEIRP